MIPILKQTVAGSFPGTYTNEVVGFLSDALSCEVTEERNGVFELVLTYPVEAPMFDELSIDRLIEAKPRDSAAGTNNNQLFRIYQIDKPINGIVTVKAEHISYVLAHYPVSNVALSGTADQVMSMILSSASASVSYQPFSVAAGGMTAVKPFSFQVGSARSALGGVQGSVLDTFGGEFEFDNYKIKLSQNRGSDNGVTVSYGKNLTDVKLTTSSEESYTALFPYAIKDDTLVTCGVIQVTNGSGIQPRVLLHDFSSEFDDDEQSGETDAAKLTRLANAYLAANDINALTVNMTVSFIHLWQTKDYESVAALERVSLCDTVTAIHEKLGINVKTKVIKTVYDSLSERYIKIELGSAKSNFADTINQATKDANEALRISTESVSLITAAYNQAILDATNAITGANGGSYKLLDTDNDENPDGWQITDGNNHFITANSGGIGLSDDAGNIYQIALTFNGINANAITTGSLSANFIRAGILSSALGDSYFNLETGLIHTANAEIVGGSIKIGNSDYQTQIANGSIKQFYRMSTAENNLLGGLVPTATGNNVYQTLYFAGEDSNGDPTTVKGISFSCKKADGDYRMLAELTSDLMKSTVPFVNIGGQEAGLRNVRNSISGYRAASYGTSFVSAFSVLRTDDVIDGTAKSTTKSYGGTTYYSRTFQNTANARYLSKTLTRTRSDIWRVKVVFDVCRSETGTTFKPEIVLRSFDSNGNTLQEVTLVEANNWQSADRVKSVSSDAITLNTSTNSYAILVKPNMAEPGTSRWVGWANVKIYEYTQLTTARIGIATSNSSGDINTTIAYLDITAGTGYADEFGALKMSYGGETSPNITFGSGFISLANNLNVESTAITSKGSINVNGSIYANDNIFLKNKSGSGHYEIYAAGGHLYFNGQQIA